MSNESRSYTVMSVTHGERRDLLQQNIESVADQLTDGEDITIRHIVLDNGSTDDTAEYLRSLEHDDDFRHLSYVISPEAVTVGAAYNRLLYIATQQCTETTISEAYTPEYSWNIISHTYDFTNQYIIPLDGDDTLEHRGVLALERIVQDAEDTTLTSSGELRDGAASMVFGSARITDAQGRPLEHPTIDFEANAYPPDQDYLMQSMWSENRIVTGTAAISLGSVLYMQGWDESASLGASDWDFWARMVAFGVDFRHDPTRTISTYRQHGGQTSRIHEATSVWEHDGVYIRQKLLNKFAGYHAVKHFTDPFSEWFRPEAMTADLVGDEIARAPETVFSKALSVSDNYGTCPNCRSRQDNPTRALPAMSADYRLAPTAPRLRHCQR